MSDYLDSVEECVDRVVAIVGHDIRLGAPLGLGKPVQLINAFYRRAKADPDISLHIFTALSLEVPTPGSPIEAALADPIMERLFGDYEDLLYLKDLRNGSMPDNIQLSEFYFKAGSMKGVGPAQRNYISTNYTHVARDLVNHGVNVLAQLVAAREGESGTEISLSSNPDTGLDIYRALRESGAQAVVIGQVHPDMPFMENDALVDADFFDLLVRNPGYDKTLFAVPNTAVPMADYATAVHASALVPDGGTLQVGVGSLGDAICHALLLRHTEPAAYRDMLSGLSAAPSPLNEDCEPFQRGLYVSSEMFVHGMMHLVEQGVVKRRVYDNLVLQEGLNSGAISERVDAALYDYGRRRGLIPARLDDASLATLRYWGVVPAELTLAEDGLALGAATLANDLDDPATRAALLAAQDGSELRHGCILHGGFFLGPRDFYRKLASLGPRGQERICMTSVLRTNQLLQDPALYRAQRGGARFINTGMMVTLTGAVASDALEDGTVISGVGGQYNFVAMAHDLPGARSILCIRSTRGQGRQVRSNIVPHYGHITVPKHLRDVIVTEYGVADLRGQCDSEIIKRLLNVTDSRFQAELLEAARAAGKIEADYRIPEMALDNTPKKLGRALKPHYRAGLLMDYPFGSELTGDEIALGASLRKIRALSEEPAQFIPRVVRALAHRQDESDVAVQQLLERVNLRHPDTPREFLVQQLLLLELEERGVLRAS